MRLIDADAFEFEATYGVMNGVLFMGRSTGRTLQLVRSCLEAMINNAPTIDAVEVVRCKDCLYYRCDNGCPLHESGYFKNGKMLPLENDFCSYGEREQK